MERELKYLKFYTSNLGMERSVYLLQVYSIYNEIIIGSLELNGSGSGGGQAYAPGMEMWLQSIFSDILKLDFSWRDFLQENPAV